jgi:Golgi phosphoprotein 3 (GPP34)/Effector-associated domain 2
VEPSRPVEPSLHDKQRLCDALLALPGMRDPNLRNMYLLELESGLGHSLALSRYSDAVHDVWSLVKTCLQHPGTLRSLAQVLQVFHGDSVAVRELARLVAQFDADPGQAAGPGQAADPGQKSAVEAGSPAPEWSRPDSPPVPEPVEAVTAARLPVATDGDPRPRLPLADELFLISHDRTTGKPTIDQEIMESGLAGALLGELLLADFITVVDRKVRPRHCDRGVDAVGATVLKRLVEQDEEYPVVEWVRYLREIVTGTVGQRLADRGLVIRERARIRPHIRYKSGDPVRSSEPVVRLARHLGDHADPPDTQIAMLAALVNATGLYRTLAIDLGRRQVRDRVAQLVDGLHPALRDVAAAVEAVVSSIPLTIRR